MLECPWARHRTPGCPKLEAGQCVWMKSGVKHRWFTIYFSFVCYGGPLRPESDVVLWGTGRNNSEVKQWDILSELDHKASLLFSRRCSVWKWLKDVWWARKETPFTTALLSLWEFIIHTDWPHSMKTHAYINPKIHTHIHSEAHIVLTVCTQFPLQLWILVGRCVRHPPHYKLTVMNRFLWTSPTPPTQTDSTTTFPPPTRCGRVPQGQGQGVACRMFVTLTYSSSDVKSQCGHGVRMCWGCRPTITWTTHTHTLSAL